MNAPVRKLAIVVATLFASLLVSTTLIQYVFAADLNARGDNRRTLLATYARERGEILVGQTPVARSVPVDDEYKFQREYSDGPLYAHATGFYSFYGAQGGLEQAENALLSGSSDKLFYRRVSDLFTGRRPQGATLETTLDPAVQKAAEDGLKGIRGAAVALDPKTGAILAMVSHPNFDPNDLASHDLTQLEKNYAKLNSDPAKPLVNRSIGGDLYPPGSVFKVVTAAAALSTGEYTEDTPVPGPALLDLPGTTADLPNHDDRPCGPNDEVTLTQALAVSCNTAFATVGMDIGAEALQSQAAKFGFGDSVTVPMRVTPTVAAQLTRMMESLVDEGTGTRAQIEWVEVAGKTGTAQHGEGRKAHAWFISFAPANDPQIAVAVIAEDGGVAGSEAGGGTVAAPIAKQMMQARLNR